MRQYLFLIVLLVSWSCSPNNSNNVIRSERERTFEPAYDLDRTYDFEYSKTQSQPLPWEGFLDGNLALPFSQTVDLIQKGDTLVRAGDRTRALNTYKRARISAARLTSAEQEALAIRIASTELSQNKATAALLTISNFFKSSNQNESDVGPDFSLIMAYAYGNSGDLRQSLAWFAKTGRSVGGQGDFGVRAKQGLEMLFATLSSKTLEELKADWDTDGFVNPMLAVELRKRARGLEAISAGKQPFWMAFQPKDATEAPNISVPDVNGEFETIVIAGLLPLSGNYKTLGQNVKNGIELALVAETQQKKVKFVVRDTAGRDIVELIRDLQEKEHPNVFLGPLLSDEAERAVEYAHNNSIPLITFSKKDELPFLGDGVYRLGATTHSQLHSLVESAVNQLGLKRFGIIYPNDSSGQEFAAVFKQIAPDYGVQVRYEATYSPLDNQGFVKLAQEVEKADLQAVFFADSLLRAQNFYGAITADWRKLIRLVGPGSWDNSPFFNTSRTVLQGTLFVSPFFDASQREIVQRFIQSYKNSYGQSPDFLAAQGFDAASLVLTALERARQEGRSMVGALGSLDGFIGLTGKIEPTVEGELKRRFAVVQLRGQELVEVGSQPESLDGMASLEGEIQ